MARVDRARRGDSSYGVIRMQVVTEHWERTMTLESWSMGIVRPVMKIYPYAWIFFVPVIMVTSFAVINLFIGVIMNSMEEAKQDTGVEALKPVTAENTELLNEIRSLSSNVDVLKSEVERLRDQDKPDEEA